MDVFHVDWWWKYLSQESLVIHLETSCVVDRRRLRKNLDVLELRWRVDQQSQQVLATIFDPNEGEQ